VTIRIPGNRDLQQICKYFLIFLINFTILTQKNFFTFLLIKFIREN